jgi:cytochrome P450
MNTRRTAPTPPGLPFLGNLHQWFREPFDAPVRWHREYGDVVRLNTPTAPIYLVNSPDLIEEVLVRRWREFRKDALTRALDMALGQGLVTSEGDRWVRHRRLVQPAFSKARMQAYMETMATVAHEHVATWQDGRTYDLLDEFNALTFRIVVKTLFDTEVTDDMSVVAHTLDVLSEDYASLEFNMWPDMPRWIPTPRQLRRHRVVAELDDVVHRMITARVAEGRDHGDLLSALLAARDEDGSAFDAEALRDEVVTLMLAGHETTAVGMTLAAELLARHPEVFDRLHAEVQQVTGGAPVTPAHLPELRYTDAVIREAWRIYPPVWGVGREPLQGLELAGYEIPAGATIALLSWVVQRDPTLWPEPERFLPERWLERPTPPHRFAWFPFGGGPRVCIGMRFALTEAVLILAAMAQRFRPERAPDAVLDLMPAVTVRPRDGLPTTLRAVP